MTVKDSSSKDSPSKSISRRTVLKAAATAGALQLVPPFIIKARGETPVKIGMVDPITGTYAALGTSEINGAKLALKQINHKGGILGRPVELVVEDSAANPGLSVQKAHKLIEKDRCSMLMGSVSSGVSLAVSPVAKEKGVVYMDTGGHIDAVTGKDCHWTTFRICTTTWMLAAGNAKTIADKFGKKWYFITPDYAYGHGLEADYSKLLKSFGGTVLGNALSPLGTTDFSSYLIKAEQAKPDVLMILTGGNDTVNCLKQAVQFGLQHKMTISGSLQEMENLVALPPAALMGWWVFEWYWDQPGVPHVKQFVHEYRKLDRRKFNYPTARSWFGYAGMHSLAMAANNAKSVDAVKVARALEGMELPPEIALQPKKVFFRAGDHQLMSSEYPGYIPKHPSYPHMYKYVDVIEGDKIALPVSETGCKLDYPA